MKRTEKKKCTRANTNTNLMAFRNKPQKEPQTALLGKKKSSFKL